MSHIDKQATIDALPSVQPEKRTDKRTEMHTCDLNDRQEEIDALGERPMVWIGSDYALRERNQYDADVRAIETVPSAQPECAKDFVMLKAIDLNGRPYYSIIYLENGNEFEGYSSYDLKVISEYLKRYFGFAQPERQRGEWIDYTEDGYVECPFCHNATNCDGNKDELHFCFSCGADMREVDDESNQ